MSEISREHLERMARIEAKVDALLAQAAEDKITQVPAETEKRLNRLEHWRYGVSGAVLISLASLAATIPPR
ncbi:hypothetical protein OG594_02685 [Streptomyces sp. NBC_01214]|uniref:hypothetical protein n=1 Tax=Streptomyces sp. NBC_01214 TaxID=2903777 RepID=UPI00224E2F63|nr:hypothetical protein [Streptomyces sp. NBC_01214]MCX4800588.1 hypothetical protein [Streptomyces sp. NBC_01214]